MIHWISWTLTISGKKKWRWKGINKFKREWWVGKGKSTQTNKGGIWWTKKQKNEMPINKNIWEGLRKFLFLVKIKCPNFANFTTFPSKFTTQIHWVLPIRTLLLLNTLFTNITSKLEIKLKFLQVLFPSQKNILSGKLWRNPTSPKLWKWTWERKPANK